MPLVENAARSAGRSGSGPADRFDRARIDRAGAREASLFCGVTVASDLARDHPATVTLRTRMSSMVLVERPGPQHRPSEAMDQPGMDLQLVPECWNEGSTIAHASQFRRKSEQNFSVPSKLHPDAGLLC